MILLKIRLIFQEQQKLIFFDIYSGANQDVKFLIPVPIPVENFKLTKRINNLLQYYDLHENQMFLED